MIDDLKTALSSWQPIGLELQRRAAILIPIIDDEGPFRVVLTRRADKLNRHTGQVAYPGGRLEPGESPQQAALREAWEEVAMPPDRVDVLGVLDDIPTIYKDTIVTPIIGHVRGNPALTPNPDEVARIFTIPLEVLAEKRNWRVETSHWEGRSYPIFYLDWEGETLWGLSAYVTMQMMQLTPFGAPFEVRAMLRQMTGSDGAAV